jgi:hypothetical protein
VRERNIGAVKEFNSRGGNDTTVTDGVGCSSELASNTLGELARTKEDDGIAGDRVVSCREDIGEMVPTSERGNEEEGNSKSGVVSSTTERLSGERLEERMEVTVSNWTEVDGDEEGVGSTVSAVAVGNKIDR